MKRLAKILPFGLLLVGVGALAWPGSWKPSAGGASGRREVGQLVVDGIPEIPPEIAERTLQYQNLRTAAALDWAPDGDGLLIRTRFADTAQIHLVASPGADRRQLTFYREPIASAAFDPKRGAGGFYFAMDAGGNENSQLYWFDRKRGRETLLTDGKSRNGDLVVWSGGDKIAYSSTRRNNTDFDLYVMTGGDPKTTRLVKEVEGAWSPGAWSPDGKQLLVHHFVSATESTLWVMDGETGATTQVNPKPEGSPKISYEAFAFGPKGKSVYYSSDEDSEFVRLQHLDLATGKKEVLTADVKWNVPVLAVSDDGKWLAYVVDEGGTSALYVAKTSEHKKPKRVELPKGVVSGLKFDRQSKRLAFTMSTPQSSWDAYSVELASRKVTRWTSSEVGGLDPEGFVVPELVKVASFDALEVPAWYYRPRVAGKRHPVVIVIHGGPEGQSTSAFNWRAQYLVGELGAAVLEPNVRGSSGYGKSYLELDNHAKREDSVKDIGALLDWIAKQPELDPERVAVMGGSYGGYMVLASMTHFADRLRCGIDIVGISNFVTFLERTEAYRRDLRRVEYGDERDPDMRALLEKISPTTNAAKITKPLFVVQGQNDPRVPVGEAEQIVATVREAGHAVWYLLAKDEGHGFQKKPNRDFELNAEALFLRKHLVE
jgi:dipeptidyl aminopeptidase/acylaminoacyl peptidase